MRLVKMFLFSYKDFIININGLAKVFYKQPCYLLGQYFPHYFPKKSLK